MEKFFIVGCPRSGTTMLQQALNRHSQIVIPPETKFFFSFFGHSLKQQIRHIERINRDLDIDLPRPNRRICSVAEGRDYYETMARQYRQRQHKTDLVYFGEKTPEHTGQLPRIRQLYPNEKIIVLSRDGRDVASSLTRVPWMSSNVYVNFLVWMYYQAVIEAERATANPNMYFVRYEDIVANPEVELARILQFLGAPYEPAVANGHGNREGVPDREFAWKARALEPITSRRSGLFQHELTSKQLDILEHLGHEQLRSLGYPLLGDRFSALPPTFFVSLSYHLARLLLRLPLSAMLKELCCRLFTEQAVELTLPACPPAQSVAHHA